MDPDPDPGGPKTYRSGSPDSDPDPQHWIFCKIIAFFCSWGWWRRSKRTLYCQQRPLTLRPPPLLTGEQLGDTVHGAAAPPPPLPPHQLGGGRLLGQLARRRRRRSADGVLLPLPRLESVLGFWVGLRCAFLFFTLFYWSKRIRNPIGDPHPWEASSRSMAWFCLAWML